MKATYNVNEFDSLDLKGIKIDLEKDTIDTHIGTKEEECYTPVGKALIDYDEFRNIHEQHLKEALENSENLYIEFEGFVYVDECELQVKGFKYNSETNKIELEVE